MVSRARSWEMKEVGVGVGVGSGWGSVDLLLATCTSHPAYGIGGSHETHGRFGGAATSGDLSVGHMSEASRGSCKPRVPSPPAPPASRVRPQHTPLRGQNEDNM